MEDEKRDINDVNNLIKEDDQAGYKELYESTKDEAERLKTELEEMKKREEIERLLEKEGAYIGSAELFQPDLKSELPLSDQIREFLNRHPYLKKSWGVQANPTNPSLSSRRLDLSPAERAMAKEMGLSLEKMAEAMRRIRNKP